MGNNSGGQASGKSSTGTGNTGQPNWSSGWTGNSPIGAPNPIGQQPGGSSSTTNNSGYMDMSLKQAPGLSGDWWNPGSDSYNSMNTQLATNPMASLLNIFNTGGGAGAQNQQNLTNTTGANDWMQMAANAFGGLGTAGTKNFQDVYNAAGTPGSNQQNLAKMASGSMVGASNPYTENIVNKGQQDAMTNLNQMFAAGGRYGSGTNQGTIADSFQNIGNQFRGQQYNQDVANQLAASGAISQEQLGRMGLQNTAAQGVGGLQQAGASGLGGLGTSAMQNWINAQQNAGALGSQNTQNLLSAMGQLGNVQNNKLFDANIQQGVGQQVDQATQAQMNDLMNQWSQGDMSDWSRLGGLLSAAQGSAGNYGSATGSSKQSSQAGLGSILGGIFSLFGG